MKRRLVCLGLLACLLAAQLPGPKPASAQIPVTDVAALVQAVIDYVKRLFEIAQRVVMIANQIQELDYWFRAMLKMSQIPYRSQVLEFLELQGELLLEFDALKGQYQAISQSLQDVTSEFDLTFPGWRAVTDMTGSVLQIHSEAGNYSFDAPVEYARYQSARTLQAVRQTLISMSDHQVNLLESQGHLAELKARMPAVEGHQQALEMQTSFAALAAEQLVALRQSQQALALSVSTLGAHRLNAEMELVASEQALARDLEFALRQEFGVLVPPHTGSGGFPPLPYWANP